MNIPHRGYQLNDELAKLDSDLFDTRQELAKALSIPMAIVMKAVPGTTETEKAKNAGVTRQTWYCWKRGDFGPDAVQAARLARLTGMDAKRIARRA